MSLPESPILHQEEVFDPQVPPCDESRQKEC